MALDTVQDYVNSARVLLQDTVAPYRYPDADLLEALNQGILEARKLRPDLFLGRFDNLPDFSAVDTTAVNLDAQYRVAFVYYMVGSAQLRDAEEGQDSRAASFLAQFSAKLLTLS